MGKTWQWKSCFSCCRMYNGSMTHDLCMLQLLIWPTMLSSFWILHYPDWGEWNVLVFWPLWLPDFTLTCTCESIWRGKPIKKDALCGTGFATCLEVAAEECDTVPGLLHHTSSTSYHKAELWMHTNKSFSSFCKQFVSMKALLRRSLINQHY